MTLPLVPLPKPAPLLLSLLQAGLLLALPLSAASQLPAATGAGSQVVGRVLDAETGGPVVGAQVRVREVGRVDLTHPDGSFHLEDLPPGTHTILVQMIGYAGEERTLTLGGTEIVQVEFRLARSALVLQGIVVTGVGRERGVAETYRPTAVLAGAELDRSLSWSLASTLRRQQGISTRSYGPSPAQPIVRGMGGDRVLVLEDGQRIGDLSTSGTDHAVGIDPIGAERIEVVRGPAGLLYGSNALGGVINVIREEIPRARPEGVSGTSAVALASANRGVTLAQSLLLPVGRRYALRGELTARRGDDVRTPLGPLPSTESFGLNGSIGASWIPDWGFIGVSYRGYLLDHGLPGEFQGVEIPGAHPGGADAETQRHVGRFQMGHFAGAGPFAALQLEGNIVRYLHEEIEATLADGTPIVGTSFDQITATLNATARHEHLAGRLEEGALGVFASYEDLLTGGAFPGVRDSRRLTLAAFLHEEIRIGRGRLQAGARYDWHRIEPVDLRPIDAGGGLLAVRTRTFGDLSGSVAALIDLSPGWVLGLSAARAFRAPSVRELFSAGPHLADFSYDIGDPELDREVGFGTDLFLRVDRPGVSVEVSFFRNRIDNFIHSRPTGLIDPRFGRFPLFVSDGADAEFLGADGRAQVEIRPSLILEGTLSWVRAEYEETGEPLPAIPPLNGGARLRYETPDYFVTLGWDASAEQSRVPFSFADPAGGGGMIVPERPTEGNALVDLSVGIRWFRSDRGHALTLTVENLMDEEWRDHLSRAKEVAPEIGRNVQLLYRLSF